MQNVFGKYVLHGNVISDCLQELAKWKRGSKLKVIILIFTTSLKCCSILRFNFSRDFSLGKTSRFCSIDFKKSCFELYVVISICLVFLNLACPFLQGILLWDIYVFVSVTFISILFRFLCIVITKFSVILLRMPKRNLKSVLKRNFRI